MHTACLIPWPQAAALLGVTPKQMRGLLAAGAPHQRGRRGPGGMARVDPAQVQRWQAAREARQSERAQLHAVLDAVPQIVAAALFETYRTATGPHKVALGQALACVWYEIANAVRDRRGLPELTLRDLPPEILHMARRG